MGRRTRFPAPRFCGSPAYWLTTKDAPGQLLAYFPATRGWETWIDARDVAPSAVATECRELIAGSTYIADADHPRAWTTPAPQLLPVSSTALQRAVSFLASLYGASEAAIYQRAHVGPAGQLGMTDGRRAHVTPPLVPGLPVGASIHWGALEYTARAARAIGAPAVGFGIDSAGAVVTRAVGPALDVITRTETAEHLPALWQIAADEPAAAAGLCAVLAVDTREQAARLRAVMADGASSRIYARADTEGVWMCGADFSDWRERSARWPGRYVLEPDRNEHKATTVCLPLDQMIAATTIPPPFRIYFRDDWSPVRVESAAGHLALVMPWRLGGAGLG